MVMAGFSSAFQKALSKILNIKPSNKNNETKNTQKDMATNELKFETLQVHAGQVVDGSTEIVKPA